MTTVVVASTLLLVSFSFCLIVFTAVRVVGNYLLARWKHLTHLS